MRNRVILACFAVTMLACSFQPPTVQAADVGNKYSSWHDNSFHATAPAAITVPLEAYSFDVTDIAAVSMPEAVKPPVATAISLVADPKNTSTVVGCIIRQRCYAAKGLYHTTIAAGTTGFSSYRQHSDPGNC